MNLLMNWLQIGQSVVSEAEHPFGLGSVGATNFMIIWFQD